MEEPKPRKKKVTAEVEEPLEEPKKKQRKKDQARRSKDESMEESDHELEKSQSPSFKSAANAARRVVAGRREKAAQNDAVRRDLEEEFEANGEGDQETPPKDKEEDGVDSRLLKQ